jgi:UDP-N-acetylmuramate dehydrogenase
MPDLEIQKNIPLAPLTTFKIGGPAEFFAQIKDKEELLEAVKWCDDNKKRFTVLGGGSNVLVSDTGIKGLVVRLRNEEIKIKGKIMECGAGALLAQAVALSLGAGLSGLEWSVGIPGTMGGAVRGNASVYGRAGGKAISDNIETAEVFDLTKEKFIELGNKDCEFGAGTSIFRKNSDLIIWQIILKLEKADEDGIQRTMNELLSHRTKSQSQPKLPSAGCVFKNLLFSEVEKANPGLAREALKEKYVVRGGRMGVGWLIDSLGLKGKIIGGAKISLEHANFIVNTGKATSDDVIMLASYIKQQVRDKYGVQLEEEVQYLGFD